MNSMLTPRRFLPSLPLLSAFEAAARTGSVTLAAKELNLTQSAVSRQIRALETQLGVDLFIRERQTIRLTLAGDAYANEIREALRRISNASLNLRANPHGGSLNLAVLPTFGARWLAPRLGDFLAAHPGITVNLVTRISPFDFRFESIDAAIHFGHPYWPGADLTYLMSEKTAPVCSPGFKARHRLDQPADFIDVPLLHLTTRPDAWEKWFLANDTPFQRVHGMLFDQFSTATQASISGLGVSLAPLFLVEEDMARGLLVKALDRELESDQHYYLACPGERMTYPPLVAFRDWLKEAAAKAEPLRAQGNFAAKA